MSNPTSSRELTPFSDAYGHLEALDGCAPAPLGRRAAARLLDTAILLGIGVVAYLPALITSFSARTYSEQQVVTGLTLFAQLVWAAVSLGYLVMLCVTGFLPGGRILGVRQVNIMGGAPGFAGIGKYALESLLNVFTCNVGLLISFVLIRPPLNRAWYDRASGIVVIDIRQGRDPLAVGSAPGAPAVVEPAPPAREAVVSVGAGLPEDSSRTPAGLDETSLVSPLQSDDLAGSFSPARSETESGIVPVADDGMIVGVPWRREASASADRVNPPALLVKSEEVVAPSSSPADVDDRTVVSTDILGSASPKTLVLVSDDGQRVPLDKVTVLGRNPSQPEGFTDARKHCVEDEQMSISKTHAVVGPDSDGVWVQDLRSTNGTAVTTVNGMRTAVPAGGRLVAGIGATVHIGKVAFKVTEQ